jgi:hypothetical protein
LIAFDIDDATASTAVDSGTFCQAHTPAAVNLHRAIGSFICASTSGATNLPEMFSELVGAMWIVCSTS